MITVTVTAHCLRCEWTTAGNWADVDKQADKHTKATDHPTATEAVPDTTTDVRPEPPGGSTKVYRRTT